MTRKHAQSRTHTTQTRPTPHDRNDEKTRTRHHKPPATQNQHETSTEKTGILTHAATAAAGSRAGRHSCGPGRATHAHTEKTRPFCRPVRARHPCMSGHRGRTGRRLRQAHTATSPQERHIQGNESDPHREPLPGRATQIFDSCPHRRTTGPVTEV